MRKVYGILGIVVCLTALAIVGYSANNKKFVRYPLEKGSLLYGALMNDNKEELKGKIVLDFGADYCPPCHQLTDMLEEEGMISYITQHGGEFRQIDAGQEWKTKDKSQTLTGKKHITSIPVLILMENGEEVARLEGYSPEKKASVVEKIKKFMQPKKK